MSARKKHKVSISLFPFLCILICTLGVLIFIVVGLCLISLANPQVTLAANGDGGERLDKPIYVECHNDTLIIQPEKIEVTLENIKDRGSAFMQLITRIKRGGRIQIGNDLTFKEYIVFAIYPDGVNSFYAAKKMALKEKIKIGYEPMDAQWQLSVD